MTRKVWLGCANTLQMLLFLQVSARKPRLFACFRVEQPEDLVDALGGRE
jgi:hypothetical protein